MTAHQDPDGLRFLGALTGPQVVERLRAMYPLPADTRTDAEKVAALEAIAKQRAFEKNRTESPGPYRDALEAIARLSPADRSDLFWECGAHEGCDSW